MLTKITDTLSTENVNIENLLNKSRKDIAYTMLDLDHEASDAIINKIRQIDGVTRVTTYAGK